MKALEDEPHSDCEALAYMMKAEARGQEMQQMEKELTPFLKKLKALFRRTGSTEDVELPLPEKEMMTNVAEASKLYKSLAAKSKHVKKAELADFEEKCTKAAADHKDLLRLCADEVQTLEFYIESRSGIVKVQQNHSHYMVRLVP